MDERGGATSVEMALLWTVLTVLILAVVQIALLFYAGQLALTAAQDGLRSGRYYAAEPVIDAARRDAEEFLARAGGSTLTDVAVTATVDDGVLRVRVTGTALSLIPGVPLAISRDAVGRLERITP
ncbi:TadE family protein [Pseudonocardia kunmingensis]|uniref:TadE-like protein n=1 Tax=Pseudonocardia kunmingensis TaxID=630975 RepID=A0A543DKG8_9PSEU|nr:TadE family protein [Pseudonocardia kunmingensis]TQM09811.1 TadE-like protein [Pseudonocardia kunmingensis]